MGGDGREGEGVGKKGRGTCSVFPEPTADLSTLSTTHALVG